MALNICWETETTVKDKKYYPQTNSGKELVTIDGELKIIDSSQRWFWTDEWQNGEKAVDTYIAQGEIEEFNSMEEFLSSLKE